MEPTFTPQVNPISSALITLRCPPVEYERISLLAAISILTVAMEFHGTDSAVIKTGYTLIPRMEAAYREILVRIICSRSPLLYMQKLLQRIGDDVLKEEVEQPTLPFACYCGAVDAAERREAQKKRYPQKKRLQAKQAA